MFGLPGDVPVTGDYDGNGVADVAVFRPATGQWFVNGGSPGMIPFGRSGDVPVPADFDGDKKTDAAVYRTTDSGIGVWFLNLPGQPPIAWGIRGDIPMPGDYDGDGLADLGIYRPATGQWFIAYGVSGFMTTSVISWGLPGDIPVRADVDNDRKLDFVVFRPSIGTWFIAPTNSAPSAVPFGLAGDIPMGVDQDGDGYSDLGVWRPATGTWFILNRITPVTITALFGLPGDIPIGARPRLPSVPVSDFDGDGVSDITVFRPSSGTWFTRFSVSGFSTTASTPFGLTGDITVNGDYDGDRRSRRGGLPPRPRGSGSSCSRPPAPCSSPTGVCQATSRCRRTTTVTAARTWPSTGLRPGSGSSRSSLRRRRRRELGSLRGYAVRGRLRRRRPRRSGGLSSVDWTVVPESEHQRRSARSSSGIGAWPATCR